MIVTAVGLKTSSWIKVIKLLTKSGWKKVYKYDEIDAGIDFDLILLRKDNEDIILGWDNWFEGEIKCEEARLRYIEKHLGLSFKLGEPENLKPEIIELYIK
ncbi:hypothetical protein [Pontibacter chitinilyticus]|uniref:hypothetical protein n=1 Tax=Pontibacter chitinilyticus TaxID=2674989 RepID=UPI00321BD9D5